MILDTENCSTGVRPSGRRRLAGGRVAPAILATVLFVAWPAAPRAHDRSQGTSAPPAQTFGDAQKLFFNAHYERAADLALALQSSQPDDAAANAELRSSALLFQLKALLEGPPGADLDKNGVDKIDKQEALRRCATCPDLIAKFSAEIERGTKQARAALAANPADTTALFLLGKLDLNYVWLQLGPLGHRTGWDEYWEARHSLDAVLKRDPQNVRAIVARAWVDYIVDTKMPFGTKWILGGGNRKKAIASIRRATEIQADFYSHAEADFALWNILLREHRTPEATDVARRLAKAFPENPELADYLKAR